MTDRALRPSALPPIPDRRGNRRPDDGPDAAAYREARVRAEAARIAAEIVRRGGWAAVDREDAGLPEHGRACACGAAISAWNRSGRCSRCASRAWADAHRDRLRENTREWDRAHRARARARCRAWRARVAARKDAS